MPLNSKGWDCCLVANLALLDLSHKLGDEKRLCRSLLFPPHGTAGALRPLGFSAEYVQEPG